jgi:hypothetical protein
MFCYVMFQCGSRNLASAIEQNDNPASTSSAFVKQARISSRLLKETLVEV